MEKVKKFIATDEYKNIEGWCTQDKVLEMIKYIKPTDLCVELGVFGGKSLLPISFMTDNLVYGIDAWAKSASIEGTNDKENDDWWQKIDYDKMYQYTLDLFDKYNCKHVNILRIKSSDAIINFENESIDFLHQDSNHSEEITCNEVELYHNKVKINGIWVFDDTNWKTTQKAQHLLLSYGYEELYDSGAFKIYRRKYKFLE